MNVIELPLWGKKEEYDEIKKEIDNLESEKNKQTAEYLKLKTVFDKFLVDKKQKYEKLFKDIVDCKISETLFFDEKCSEFDKFKKEIITIKKFENINLLNELNMYRNGKKIIETQQNMDKLIPQQKILNEEFKIFCETNSIPTCTICTFKKFKFNRCNECSNDLCTDCSDTIINKKKVLNCPYCRKIMFKQNNDDDDSSSREPSPILRRRRPITLHSDSEPE